MGMIFFMTTYNLITSFYAWGFALGELILGLPDTSASKETIINLHYKS